MSWIDKPLGKGVFGALSIAVVWELLARVLGRPSVLPPFSNVVASLGTYQSILLQNIGQTALSTVTAFALAFALAGAFGAALAEFKLAERLLLYPIVALQNVPKVALAPLLVLWLSYGMAPKVAMGALIAFFPIFEGFRAGLTDDRTGLRSTLDVLGTSKWRMFINVKLPEAMPSVMRGSRVGITFALIGVIVGEMVQPSQGLGYLIDQGKEDFQTDLQYAAVLLVSIVGLILYGAVVALGNTPGMRRFSYPLAGNVQQG